MADFELNLGRLSRAEAASSRVSASSVRSELQHGDGDLLKSAKMVILDIDRKGSGRDGRSGEIVHILEHGRNGRTESYPRQRQTVSAESAAGIGQEAGVLGAGQNAAGLRRSGVPALRV